MVWRCVKSIQLKPVFAENDTIVSINLSFLKKGPQIKSYLISHPYILAGFKMWKHLNLSYAQVKTLRILYCKCVNLYLVLVKIYLIRILCQSTATRCLKTASTRCVLKIYNVTRLNLTTSVYYFWWASGKHNSNRKKNQL